MNKTKFQFLLIVSVLVISSCQFSKGVKKDLNTGLSTSYNGFKLEDIYLADAGGNKLNNNSIKLGAKVLMLATGVDYFSEKDGKVYPGCQIVLTDKNKSEILNLADAFADMKNGTTPAEVKTLQATLNTGQPMVSGETYHLFVRFYDKNNKEKEIVSNVDLKMEE